MRSKTYKFLLLSLLGMGVSGLSSQAATYNEVGGIVVVEAEHFDSRADGDDGHKFVIAPDELSPDDTAARVGQYLNARGGKYLANVPESGQNRNNPDAQIAGPKADYKVQINTPGEYTLYVRNTGYDGGSDSCYFSIVEISSPGWFRYGPTPADGDFNTDRHGTGLSGWDNMLTPEVNDAGGNEVSATWTIAKAGIYTVRWQQREDNNAFDAFVLQRSNLPPPGANVSESPIVGAKPEPLKVASRVPAADTKAAPFGSPVQVSFQDGTTTLDQSSVVIKLDGTAVANPTKTSAAGITTFSYQPPGIFAPASTHTVSVDFKDNAGKAANESWTFTVQNYNIIPASAAVTADTSKKGFLVRTWKSTGEPNTIAWAEEQLAGLHGDNEADPTTFTDKQYGNSYFDETGTINYWNTGGQGNFSNNDASGTGVQNTPGLANDGTNDDNYALEVITYLDLPAGVVKMGVNSDDGFRVYSFSGDPRDKFAKNLGQFDAGRGVADTTFQFVVEKAGIYPFRMIYEEGGGDSAVEWFTLASDNTRHLINDANDAKAIKAYRPVAGATPAYISSVTPGVGAQDQDATTKIGAVMVDGSNKISPSSVKMTLDGADLKATATKAGDTTTATVAQISPFVEGSKHTLTLTYSDSSTPPATRTVSWDFSTKISETTFVAGTLFIEAEDFNFDKGNYLKNVPIGMTGKYAGGDYKDKGNGKDATGPADGTDLGVDYFEVGKGSDQAIYRPETGVEAGKTDNAGIGFSRGLFDVTVNHVIGWNDAGDWYNYTRQFPEPAKNYNVYARLSSGGADEAAELAEITGGAKTPTQTKVKLGTFKAKATGGWETFHIVQLKDDAGNPAAVNLGGERTVRFTTLPGNLDFDYLAFVLAAAAPSVGKFSSIKLSGTNITIEWTGGGTLQEAADVTGPWADVAGATSPRALTVSGNRKFYRLKQ